MIEAAGGLVWRDAGTGRELLLVHRPRYDDWALPKGKLNRGERWEDAALREVWEETGRRAALGFFAGCACYDVADGAKVVAYWNMRVVGDERFTPSEEVDRAEWVSAADALHRLTYAAEREIVARNAAG